MMQVTTVVVAAVLLASRAPAWVAAVVALLIVPPIVGIPAAVGGAIVLAHRGRRKRRRALLPVSVVLRSLADEMRAGRTFPQAIEALGEPVADRTVRRLVAAGADATTIAEAAGRSFGRHRSTFVAAVSMSEVAGASLAEHLQRMAEVAEADEAAERERRVSTSQARFSALVVGGVPVFIAAAVVALRGIPEPGGAIVVVPMALGAALLVAGSAAVAWMSRPGRRR